MRRIEIHLAALLLALASLAAYLGAQSGWNEDLLDPRRSTYLTGPQGARALAETIERLGVPVHRRERGFFALADSAPDPGTRYMFLDLPRALTDRERQRVTTVAARGGHLALVGSTGLEVCFGVQVEFDDEEPRELSSGPALTSEFLLPPVDEWYGPLDLFDAGDLEEMGCAPFQTLREDTLLMIDDDRPVAITLTLAGGGTVQLTAASSLYSNETLRDTDAGLVLIPWLLEPGVAAIVVDEYHQGFGTGGSLWGAAWAWLRASPAGWAVLQLFGVAVGALFALGVRFGPPPPFRQVPRRSEIEHVNALAAGLQQAGGHATAVQLLINGLRRRLGRSEHSARLESVPEGWIDAFQHLDTPPARQAIDTLRDINREPEATRVRAAAQAVEDLWTAMTIKS